MYGQGPIATIHYNISGFPAMDSGALLGGFIHMLVVTLLMAAAVYFLSRHVAGFSERVKMLVLAVLAAAIFMRLGDPIWYHHGWGHARSEEHTSGIQSLMRISYAVFCLKNKKYREKNRRIE